jgi:hypothetical protein
MLSMKVLVNVPTNRTGHGVVVDIGRTVNVVNVMLASERSALHDTLPGQKLNANVLASARPAAARTATKNHGRQNPRSRHCCSVPLRERPNGDPSRGLEEQGTLPARLVRVSQYVRTSYSLVGVKFVQTRDYGLKEVGEMKPERDRAYATKRDRPEGTVAFWRDRRLEGLGSLARRRYPNRRARRREWRAPPARARFRTSGCRRWSEWRSWFQPACLRQAPCRR